MSEIGIDFDSVSVHQVRNFGEALWDALKDEKPASIALADVDRASNQLRIQIRYPSKRRIGSTIRIIEQLLGKHFLLSNARVPQADNR